MIASEGTLPTRGTIARKALRETVVAAAAWSCGAWLIWRFGHGTFESDLGLVIVAFVVAIAVGVALTAVWQGRLPPWPGWHKRGWDIRSGVGFLIGYFTLPALARAADSLHTMTALGVWVALGILLLVYSAIDYGLKLMRPQGFAEFRPSGTAPVGAVVVVAALLVASLAAWWVADAIVAQAHVVPIVSDVVPPNVLRDIQPSPQVPLPEWMFVWVVAAGGFILWWAGAARAFLVSGALLYVLLISWSEVVWRDVRAGDIVLDQDPRGIVLAQVASGGLLLLALLTAAQFRPGRSLIPFAIKVPRTSTMP